MEKRDQLFYEKYVNNDLPQKMRDNLVLSEDEKRKIKGIEESNREFFEQYPSRFVPQETSSFTLFNAARVLVPVTFCLVALFFGNWLFKGPEESTMRQKGAGQAVFQIFKGSDSSGPRELKEGDKVQQGDRLQMVVNPGKNLHVAILSIDGNQFVTIHFPPESEHSKTLSGKNQNWYMDYSWELDDAPTHEIFYCITSKFSFALEPLVTAVKSNPLNLEKKLKNKTALNIHRIYLNK